MQYAPLTNAQVIRWWELRRPLYNGVLLLVGLASLAAMEWIFSTVLPIGEDVVSSRSRLPRASLSTGCAPTYVTHWHGLLS